MGYGFCGDRAYLRDEEDEENSNNEVDPNIVEIKFDDLIEKQQNNTRLGDPIICTGCQVFLNKFSKTTLMKQQQIWTCEFCGNQNKIKIENEEIPIEEDTIYLIEPAILKEQLEKDNQQENGRDNSVIFCVDNSGSMQDHKKSVLSALKSQFEEIEKTNNNQLVGLVTFSDKVLLIGDGSKQQIIIKDDQLDNEQEIIQICEQAKDLLTLPINSQGLILKHKLDRLKMQGQTALGPALVSSLEMAKQGKVGSMIVICTDGQANLGIGTLECGKENKFYTRIADQASELGIIISIVTIKGNSCRMDVLSQLAEKTNGNVYRVSSKDVEKNFSEILKDQLLATNVEIDVKLHKCLQFRNEQGLNKSTTLKKMIKNATVETTSTFEYEVRSKVELTEMGIDLKQIKQVPFQIQIRYTDKKGDKCVWATTKTVDATQDLMEIEENANVEMMQKRIVQNTTGFQEGTEEDALKYNKTWEKYIQKNQGINKNSKEMNLKFQIKNKTLRSIMKKKQKKQKKEKNKNKSSEDELQQKQKIPKKTKKEQKLKQSKKQKQDQQIQQISDSSDSDSNNQQNHDSDEEEVQIQNFKKGKLN